MITESDSGQNAYLEKVSSTLSVCTEETEPVKKENGNKEQEGIKWEQDASLQKEWRKGTLT